ncbi:hypothetical protein IKG16_03165 [Candidatus Saccharibacteria bacterium]|nr:hypothetical protein [Candidatus Saccharibacteria bacterium]
MSIGRKIRMMMLVGMMVGAIGCLGRPAMAITCEEGSLRAGDDVASAADCNVAKNSGENAQDVNSVVTTIVGVLIAILGIVAVLVVIYGGAQMVLSQGDPGKVKTGKMAIFAGVMGLVIALLAWAIVNFILAAI